MSEWPSVPFGRIAKKLVNGGTPPTDVPRYWSGQIPWVTGADFTPAGIGEFRRFVSDEAIRETATNVIEEGQLLLVTRTGVGKLAIAPCDIAISQDITGVYVDEEQADTAFLFHRMRQGVEDLKKLNQGTSINGIIRSDLVSYPVKLPPLSQQRRIAEILSTLDEAIEQTEALIAKMQQVKAGLMHDLFTRGVTPDGRLRPTREQAPELYKESAIGWIPREWGVSCCASEFIIDSGITLGPHRRPRKSPYPYLRVANVSRDSISLDDVALLEATPVEVSALGLKTFDLLVVEGHANRNEIGRCSMVFNDAEGMLFQNHLFRLRPIRLGPRYSLLWLNSFYAQSYWESKCATSSGLYTINRKLLGAMPVIVPPVEEQGQIGEIVFSFREKESVNASYLSKFRQQKQGLMCDLLSGSVQVSELIGERSMDIAIAE